MNRRGFLKTAVGGLVVPLAFPAIVRAESLMKIIVPQSSIIIAPAYQAFVGVVAMIEGGMAYVDDMSLILQWKPGDGIWDSKRNTTSYPCANDVRVGDWVDLTSTGEVIPSYDLSLPSDSKQTSYSTSRAQSVYRR